MSYKLVVKDAVWQIVGRVISSLCGFFVVKIISPYLGPLRYGDYGTILKFFAIRSAWSDFGLYVIALQELGRLKEKAKDNIEELKEKFGKYVGARLVSMTIVYVLALIVAYLLPSYTSNPYLIRGMPLGMLFSASFMAAGIQQLPLQIFWKMEKVSISLVLARVTQIIVLLVAVLFLFPIPSTISEIFGNILPASLVAKISQIGLFPIAGFDGSKLSIIAFVLIIFSVLASSIAQNIYVHFAGQKYIPLKIKFDRKFTLGIFGRNRRYGLSAGLSSFHTLIVLIFLSLRFPTSKGFAYTGIWAFALAFIEILLIVPSSLGNSLLHKVPSYTIENKRKSFGNLMSLMIWIGGVFFINFIFFSERFVKIVGGTKFLTASLGYIGSDVILPFLGIVLGLSFIKQVFNYLFVATDNQNKLLRINLFGVACGLIVGLFIIPTHGIRGGVIVQVLLEVLFVLGALYVAYKQKVMPTIRMKKLGAVIALLLLSGTLGYGMITYFPMTDAKTFFIEIVLLNSIMVGIAFPIIKKLGKGLTVEETGELTN